MGIFKAIGDFLFGKDPDIFDETGRVRHKLPEAKYKAWNDRFHNSSYDWRQHTGTNAGAGGKSPSDKDKSSQGAAR